MTQITEHPIGCCLQPIGCSVEAVATMIGCLPTQAIAFGWKPGLMLLTMRSVSAAAAGSLQIRRSQESDEGKYECLAENSVGVAYSYGANLYVRGTTTTTVCF